MENSNRSDIKSLVKVLEKDVINKTNIDKMIINLEFYYDNPTLDKNIKELIKDGIKNLSSFRTKAIEGCYEICKEMSSNDIKTNYQRILNSLITIVQTSIDVFWMISPDVKKYTHDVL